MKNQYQNQKTEQGALKYLNTPCTITEATQIARGVAEDVLVDYQRTNSPFQVAMSIQIEIIREALIESGLITEELFKESYIKRAEEFNRLQQSASDMNQEESIQGSPKMDMSVNDIDVTIKE